jgi:gluconate 2-dehydrogenase alpha chain
MQMVLAPDMFADAARSLGHKPFPGPSANMSRAYTNPLGVTLAPCTYCGFCEKFACGNYSKATAATTILPVLMRKGNFTLRTQANVLRVLKDAQSTRATGVEYITPEARSATSRRRSLSSRPTRCTTPACCCSRALARPTSPAPGRGRLEKTTPTRSPPGSMSSSTTWW